MLGLLALVVPPARVWRNRHAGRGRTSGSRTFMTRWPLIFALTILYLIVGRLLWTPIPLALPLGLRWGLLMAGAALYLGGILLYSWGFLALGPMFGVSSGASAQLYQRHRLVIEGPYAMVRHPMYLGVLMAALGALLLFRTWAMAIFAPSAFVVVLRARREESLLREEFGDAWVEYSSRVPGWIPRLSGKGGTGSRSAGRA